MGTDSCNSVEHCQCKGDVLKNVLTQDSTETCEENFFRKMQHSSRPLALGQGPLVHHVSNTDVILTHAFRAVSEGGPDDGGLPWLLEAIMPSCCQFSESPCSTLPLCHPPVWRLHLRTPLDIQSDARLAIAFPSFLQGMEGHRELHASPILTPPFLL